MSLHSFDQMLCHIIPKMSSEKLALPSTIEILSIMLDDKMTSVLKSMPHSDNIGKRRIKNISEDLMPQVVENIIADDL